MNSLEDQYFDLQKIGQGAFGLVFKARNQQGQTVAIKTINKKTLEEKAKAGCPPELQEMSIQYHFSMIQHEVDIMKKISNEHVLKLYDFIETADEWYFILECCEQDLQSYTFNETNQQGFTENKAIELFIQILKGMKAINDAGYIHRDLKCSNVLVDKNGVLKICDFGFSKPQNAMGGTQLGTAEYMAPEISDSKQYNYKVDIWALGVVLFQMIFYRLPFNKGEYVKVFIRNFCKIKDFDIDAVAQHSKDTAFINKANVLSNEIKDLFKQMFKFDPDQRIDYEQLYKHPALEKYLKTQDNNFQIDMQQIFGTVKPSQIVFDSKIGMIKDQQTLKQSAIPFRQDMGDCQESKISNNQLQQSQGPSMQPQQIYPAFGSSFSEQQEGSHHQLNSHQPQQTVLQSVFPQQQQQNLIQSQQQNQSNQQSQVFQSAFGGRMQMGDMMQSNFNKQSLANSKLNGNMLSFVKVDNPQLLMSNLSLNNKSISDLSQEDIIKNKLQEQVQQNISNSKDQDDIIDRCNFELQKNNYLVHLIQLFDDCPYLHHQQLTNYFLVKAHIFFTNELIQNLKSKKNFTNLQENQFQALINLPVYDEVIKTLEDTCEQYRQKLKQAYISAQDDLNNDSKKQYQIGNADLVRNAVTESLDTQDFQEFKKGYRGFLEYEFKQIYNNRDYTVNELKLAFLLFIALIRNRAFEFDGPLTTKDIFKYLYRERGNMIKNRCDFLEQLRLWNQENNSEEVVLKSINNIWNLVFGKK